MQQREVVFQGAGEGAGDHTPELAGGHFGRGALRHTDACLTQGLGCKREGEGGGRE